MLYQVPKLIHTVLTGAHSDGVPDSPLHRFRPDVTQVLELAPNASSGLLAVDEAAGEAYYVVNVPLRVPGPPARYPCTATSAFCGPFNFSRISRIPTPTRAVRVVLSF